MKQLAIDSVSEQEAEKSKNDVLFFDAEDNLLFSALFFGILQGTAAAKRGRIAKFRCEQANLPNCGSASERICSFICMLFFR
jgi:hypothetical protein